MQLRRLSATFGRLERRTLAFMPGLNIIESPNESGKSTLAAFLRVMLYGLQTRERGTLADKHRYLPWSGSAMQGTLELSTEEFGDIVLRRDTARASSPMGRFSATYAGTGNDVAELSGADCGERLLGVPREVYERSAFIRQSGLAVDADTELERRIAVLITTGEEGVSYSEAAGALKKQLNLRRANARSGQIPALEREIEADAAALAEARELLAEQGEAEQTLAELKAAEAELREALAIHELADKQEQFAARESLKRAADDAGREARVFCRMLEDSHVPQREVLEENRSRLRAAEDLDRQKRSADAAREDAELALNSFDATPRPGALRAPALVWLLLTLLSAAVVPYALLTRRAMPPAVLYGSAGAVVIFAALFTLEWLRARERRRLHAQERERLQVALREAEASCAALKSASENTFALIYEAIPALDAASAGVYIHENLARRDMLAQMQSEANQKRQAFEAFPRPDLTNVPARPVKRPERSPEALRAALDRVVEQRAQARSRVDYTAGRLRSLGDVNELEAALEQKRERLALAQEEYDSLALASEALERANTALQNRFSPELGKRAAEYLSALTGGKYDGVALDRSFHALASESGESVERDGALLSRGATDQLYLAVRLAICDIVLPEDKRVPLVLDDALVNFDDARCDAALELLLRCAQTRQIILLTCQHREAARMAGRLNTHISTL